MPGPCVTDGTIGLTMWSARRIFADRLGSSVSVVDIGCLFLSLRAKNTDFFVISQKGATEYG